MQALSLCNKANPFYRRSFNVESVIEQHYICSFPHRFIFSKAPKGMTGTFMVIL